MTARSRVNMQHFLINVLNAIILITFEVKQTYVIVQVTATISANISEMRYHVNYLHFSDYCPHFVAMFITKFWPSSGG